MIRLKRPRYKDKIQTNHPLYLIEGSVTEEISGKVEAVNYTTGSVIVWPVVGRLFKVLLLLKPGDNNVELQHGFYRCSLRIVLAPLRTPYVVQPLYIICKDDDGAFQSPPGADNSVASATRRIALGCALLQTFTAINLLDVLNCPDVTFNLPLDSNSHLPLCKVFRSSYTRAMLYNMTEKELWRCLAKEIIKTDALTHHEFTKYLAFLSCTRYDSSGYVAQWKHSDLVGATKGYVAIGGGGLAVLGTATLHTWAEKLEEITDRFTDNTLIDKHILLDDSAYRQTYWANYATGLGAVLHELGHTMDLSHTESGIMARGFDNIHQVFVAEGARNIPQHDPHYISRLFRYSKLADQTVNEKGGGKTSCDIRKISIIPVIDVLNHTHRQSWSSINSKKSLIEPQQVKTPRVDTDKSQPCSALCSRAFGGSTSLQNLNRSSSTPSSRGSTCTWSIYSAVMLRYSRWLLPTPGFKENSEKLYWNSSRIVADVGVRAVLLYCKCLGCICAGRHFLEDNPPNVVNLCELPISSISHADSCQGQCLAVQVRDNGGNFLQFNLVK